MGTKQNTIIFTEYTLTSSFKNIAAWQIFLPAHDTILSYLPQKQNFPCLLLLILNNLF